MEQTVTWYFLDTGCRSGRFNMALDEELADRVGREDMPPVLRVFGWSPPTISIGFNQHEDDFDREKMEAAGIGLVRRPTGGRAILHAEELTYSVVLRSEDRGPRAIYRFISEGLLCGLRSLGIDATLTGRDDDFPHLYQDPSSIPCFASSAKCEIQFEGKKLVGSAQRRFGRAVLQHGSILLGPGHRRITEFLAPRVRHVRDVIEDHLVRHTVDAGSILGRPVPFEETASCIRKGFETACGVTFADTDLETVQNAAVH